MSDLIERLRNPKYTSDQIEFLECRIEAADEIERLQGEAVDDAVENANLKAEIERLRGKLQNANARYMSAQTKADRLEVANAKLQAVVDAADEKHYQGLGWMYTEACRLMDEDKDIRDIEVPELIERCRAALEGGDDAKCARCGAYYSTEIGYCTCGGA